MMPIAIFSSISLFLVTFELVRIPFPVSWFGYAIVLAVYLIGIYVFFVNLYNYWALQNAKALGGQVDGDEVPPIGFTGGEA